MERLLSSELRVPWWHWALVSLCSTLLLVGITLAGIVALFYVGVDITDYIYLSRPPFIQDGYVAALLVLILISQTAVPVMVLACFRPGRMLSWGRLTRPEDPGGMLLRVLLGLGAAVLVQIGWAAVAPQPAEQLRVVHHIVYAVIGGGATVPVAWVVVAFGLVVPFAEELLFRGLIFGLLRRRTSFLLAALVSSAMFGVAHGLQHAIPTALLGFYLAYQVEQDESLLGAIALHAIHNLGALVAIAAGL